MLLYSCLLIYNNSHYLIVLFIVAPNPLPGLCYDAALPGLTLLLGRAGGCYYFSWFDCYF